MVKTKQLVPEVYSQSFDFSVFTGLLDLVYTARELDFLRAKESHSPLDCFQEDLPRLASLLDLPEASSRQLLSDYRQLIQHKGTRLALEALAAFATNQLPKEGLVTIERTVSQAATSIKLYLPFDSLDDQILDKLIHKLAPVGASIQVLPLEEFPQ